MPIKVEKVTEPCTLGEGPFWMEEKQSLYFVDIVERTVCCYTPASNSFKRAKIGDNSVSFIIPIKGEKNKFMISHGSQLATIVWDGKSDTVSDYTTITDVKRDDVSVTWNDAKIDPSGRLFAGVLVQQDGVMVEKAGILYSLLPDRTLKIQETGISLTNGLAWNLDINKFYYIDSMTGEVNEYDYDDAAGKISNRKVIFSFGKNGLKGIPDGMTIDSEGNLYVAAFGGGNVIKIDPRKPEQIVQVIDIPALQVTSVEFGGPDYEELYVTSATLKTTFCDVPEGPEQGVTYKVTGLGSKGLPGRKLIL